MDQIPKPTNNNLTDKNIMKSPSVPPAAPLVSSSLKVSGAPSAPSIPTPPKPVTSPTPPKPVISPAPTQSNPQTFPKPSPAQNNIEEPIINMNTQHSGQQFKLSTSEVQGPKPPLVSGSGSKFALIAIGVILIIIVGIGGYYFYTKDNDVQPIASSTPNVPASTPVADKNLDSDKDGLSDSIEKVLGTYMTKADTDSDGFNDLQEIKSGYSPLISGAIGKYTQEEWDNVKGKIKIEDNEFYKREFETPITPSPSPSLSPSVSPAVSLTPSPEVSLNEDYSTPEATYKVYLSALEIKNLALYRKTLDKESLKKLDQDSVFSASSDVSKWKDAEILMWKKAEYISSEQASKYSIMVPKVREQINSPEGVTPVKYISMPDMYFRLEDNLWKIDFVTTSLDMIARVFARSDAVAKGSDINLAEENSVKQLKADWIASFK